MQINDFVKYFGCFFLLFLTYCQHKDVATLHVVHQKKVTSVKNENADSTFLFKLANAAANLKDVQVRYVSDYISIDYPNGDVPSKTGVCSDVVVRAYRKLGVDLQVLVHEDMKKHFNLYPKIWGLTKTDTNIDHRRVPNLEVFFTRKGKKLAVTSNSEDYFPGHLVTWRLGGTLPHIGVVTHQKSSDGKRFLIMHNIGGGQVIEDVLFAYPITGHYIFEP
jgi:uncharacterized protein